MWLITAFGFFSVVEKPGDRASGNLTVRARVHGDLDALRDRYLPELGPIEEGAGSDYRFRAQAPRDALARAVARSIDDLDYGNFKDAVADKQGASRAKLYGKVWQDLYELQTDPAFLESDPQADSHGGVVVSGGGKVLLREPTEHFAGYAWTFAKTAKKPGESPRDTAIRAVREKTGYAGEIRAIVPGTFATPSGSTGYFVLDARHPPAPANWQTAGLRWATWDEARDLIRQSANEAGRERDLAVLAAAQRAARRIPYREHPNVQPEDWENLRAMPERHTVLHPKLGYDPEAMWRIRRGFHPTVMEQKWFLVFTNDRLRMHRSWTGILIYDVGFAFDAKGGARVTEVVVNREPREYGCTDDREDATLIEAIIRGHLLEPLDAPVVDGIVLAMMEAVKPNYLGAPGVVTTLVKPVFDAAALATSGGGKRGDIDTAVDKVVGAFTGALPGYTRMPRWHTADGLGSYVRKYLAESTVGSVGDSLDEILRAGMAALVGKLREMLDGLVDDPAAEWQEHALVQLTALHQFVVAVLLGTNTVAYGEKKLADFAWQTVTAGDPGAESETVLLVGGEGGDVKLVRRSGEEGWEFRVETGESGLLDEDQDSATQERPWVATWRSAMKRLDAYPWPQLHPIAVHPEFHDRVLNALRQREKKGATIDWESWHNLLGSK